MNNQLAEHFKTPLNMLLALVSVMQKTARILLKDSRVTFSSVNGGPGWAYTDGASVYFDRVHSLDMLAALKNIPRWVIHMKGLSYHEQAHILFSRFDVQYQSKVQEVASARGINLNHLLLALNILEDQRIERLYIGTYSPAITYLSALVVDGMETDPGTWIQNYPLTVGRFWLPEDLRDTTRNWWLSEHGPDSAELIETLVAAYQRLSRTNLDRMVGIGADLAEHLYGLEQGGALVMQPLSRGQGDDHKVLPPPPDMQATAEDEERANDQAEALEEAINDLLDEDGTEDGDGAGESDNDEPQKPRAHQLREAAAEAAEELEADVADEIKADMEQLDREIVKPSPLNLKPQGKGGMRTDDVPNSCRTEVARTKRVLDRLNTEKMAQWHRGHHSGKLNMRRVVLAKASDRRTPADVFDRFQDGAGDDTDVEIVVLLDTSISMASHQAKLGQIQWMLEELDRYTEDVRITIIGYDRGHRVLHVPGSRDHSPTRYTIPALGDYTQPTSAIILAAQVLGSSVSTHRGLVVFTDGEWDSKTDQRKPILNALVKDGVEVIGVDFAQGQLRSEGFHNVVKADRPEVVTEVVNNMVTRLLKA